MKYFLHDSNSFADEKITLLYIKYGYEGIGLFFTILEKLSSQEKPINELVLKNQLNIKKRLEKLLKYMYEIDILSLRNGDVFNENILNFSEKYKIKKEKNREKISHWREKQGDIKNVTSYEPVCNSPKVKESKVKESKVKRVFIPPIIGEVITYFTDNGYTEESARRAFKYYNEAAWKDSRGKQVLNWKQKMISVWFKDENKTQKRIVKLSM